MANVVIIGSGPAGISSALYTVRSGLETTVISKGGGSLHKAEIIENYYGFAEPVTGEQLENAGIEGAKRLGVKFVAEEVVGLSFGDKLEAVTSGNSYEADSIILATGSRRSQPKIPGIKEYEGKGISYCATCDAFFYRNKNVAVLGNGEYALHEAMILQAVAQSVTILTNGSNPTVSVPETIRINDKKISSIIGGEKVSGINFSDGSSISADGIFIAFGVAGSTDLARKIGALTYGNKIVVDENMATNIPGLFAAGDCTGGLLQIAKAVYDGAKAGTEAVKYVRKMSSVLAV